LALVNQTGLQQMFYFKKEILQSVNAESIEIALRKFTAKRNTSLDMQSSSTSMGTDKLFLGLENENSIQITRIRSSLEKFLPKLIIKFDKVAGFNQYKVRYSLLSNVVFAFTVAAIILNSIYSISNGELESGLTTAFIFICLFLLLSAIEFRLTKLKLKSAIS
jgi:hypothetical protein